MYKQDDKLRYDSEWRDERVQDGVGDIAGALEHAPLDVQACLRDEPGLKELLATDAEGLELRVTIQVEEYTPRFYDPPIRVRDTVEEVEYLYDSRLYRVCEMCSGIEYLGPLEVLVEETGRTYEWRDIPAAQPNEDYYQRDGTIRIAVSRERPSLCNECYDSYNWVR